MSKIIISRASQRINRMREYDIYLDQEKISSINDSEKKIFEVSQGYHQIYMKIDWCKSKKLNLNLTKEQEVSLVCGSTISGLKQLFVLFYLFFPSKWIYLDYLSDDKVIFENNNTLTWNNIKDIGIKKFILKYGIVRWGIPTGILYSILMLLVDSNIHSIKSFIISTVINILIFSLLGGSLFGIVIWKFLKNKNT